MRRIHRHVTYANVVATFALFLALGGSAYAVAGNPFVGRDGSISGCVQRSDGVLSVAKTGKRCPRGTIAITFNEKGRRGEAGRAGRTGGRGPQGADGATGLQGPAGAQGPQGSTGPQGPVGSLAGLAGQHCTPSGANRDEPMAFGSTGAVACYPTVAGSDACGQVVKENSHQQLCDFTDTGPQTLVDLAGSDLRGASFTGMVLVLGSASSNFAGADMRWDNLRGTDLTNVNLAGADMQFADLTGATLTGAHLAGVNWFMAKCPGGQVVTTVGGVC